MYSNSDSRWPASWSRLQQLLISIGCAWVMCTPAMATELFSMNVETQMLDLDTGNVIEESNGDLIASAGADFILAYNADRSPHAVVFLTGETVEMSYVASVGFDGISAADIPNLTFSSEPIDLPISANECVVIHTDQGAFFKLGNTVENGMSVTFNYVQLQ